MKEQEVSMKKIIPLSGDWTERNFRDSPTYRSHNARTQAFDPLSLALQDSCSSPTSRVLNPKKSSRIINSNISNLNTVTFDEEK